MTNSVSQELTVRVDLAPSASQETSISSTLLFSILASVASRTRARIVTSTNLELIRTLDQVLTFLMKTP
jgi:hypothetical protein